LPWQYHALIGFLVFIAVMIWMIVERQTKLNEQIPNIIPGNTTEAKTHYSKDGINIRASFRCRNNGNKPAYNICIRFGLAPENMPEKIKIFFDHRTPNPLEPSAIEYGRDFTIKLDSNLQPFDKWVFYTAVLYSSTVLGGRQFYKEWWFSYKVNNERLDNATFTQKEAMEPYVRSTYVKVTKKKKQIPYIQGSQN
jgi:hypothetical protein